MYNFDKMTQRRLTGCYKWDEPENEGVIPMWVADMDFEAMPEILQALQDRVAHGVFGYTKVGQTYYDSITRWYERRHGWHIPAEWVIYTSGVVPAVSAAIRALTMPSEQVLMMTPAYNCFFPAIRNNGCEVVESRLQCNISAEGVMQWSIDFEDFEEKCKCERVRCFLLCNPHNPVGRVWTKDELQRMADICLRHNVTIIADEIHNEIVMPGHKYTPMASLSDEVADHCITCCSPTKGFNIAGLQIANIVVKDSDLRYRVDRAINIMECCDVNPFGVIALQVAYDKGDAWLDELCAYINENYRMMCEALKEAQPEWRISPLEGTYLAWIDISASGLSAQQMADRLLNDCGVMVSAGTLYGAAGEGFIRVNLACQRARLQEALRRIEPLK